jgi:hypothetical protein
VITLIARREMQVRAQSLRARAYLLIVGAHVVQAPVLGGLRHGPWSPWDVQWPLVWGASTATTLHLPHATSKACAVCDDPMPAGTGTGTAHPVCRTLAARAA